MRKRVIIIGGGAAGSMTALTAAQNGADVLLLEQNEIIGRKILSTGNGRCNFTNRFQDPSCYRSDNSGFAWKSIGKFSEPETTSFFKNLGIYPKDKNGYLYPWSEQASAVREALESALKLAKIRIHTGVRVFGIIPKKNGFQISFSKDGKKGMISGEAVILAAGSKAAAKLGSDGSGYDLAKMLGHKLVPVVPALVQLRCREKLYRQVAGVRTHGKVTVFIDGTETASDIGELQLTDYGISGIPVFQISRYAARGLYEKKEVFAELDFMPDFGDVEFLQMLKERKIRLDGLVMEQYFNGLFHKKLAGALLKRIGISGTMPVHDLSEENLERLCLYEKKEVFAELDFMPDFGDVEFLQMLKERKIRLDGLVMEQYFNGLFHKKLAGALLKRIGISGTMPVHDLSEENLERLCRICKHFRTYIDKTNPFEQAQICAGGVDTSEIDPDTMESKLVKGLYFAGEILDVDGICGGYNLQWAWTSGYLAGKGAANA